MQSMCCFIPQENQFCFYWGKCLCFSIYEIMDSKFWEVAEPEDVSEATWLYCLHTLCLSSCRLDWVPGDVNFALPLALACCVILGKPLALSGPQLPHLVKERCALVCWALLAGTLQKYKTLSCHCFGTFLDKGHLVYRGSTASRKNYVCYVGQIEQDLIRDLESTLSIQETLFDTLNKESVWILAFLIQHSVGLYCLGLVNYFHGIHLLHEMAIKIIIIPLLKLFWQVDNIIYLRFQ